MSKEYYKSVVVAQYKTPDPKKRMYLVESIVTSEVDFVAETSLEQDNKKYCVETQLIEDNDHFVIGEEVDIIPEEESGRPDMYPTPGTSYRDKYANRENQKVRLNNLYQIFCKGRATDDTIQKLRASYPHLIFTENNTVIDKTTGVETNFRDWYVNITFTPYKNAIMEILHEGNINFTSKEMENLEKVFNKIEESIKNLPDFVPPISDSVFNRQIFDVGTTYYTPELLQAVSAALKSLPQTKANVKEDRAL